MKKLLLTFAAVAMTLASTFGQGQVSFRNLQTGAIDAKVVFQGTTIGVEGPTYKTQLVLVNGANLTAVGSPVAFRTGNAAGYISPSVVTIDGVAPNASATLRMVVFTTDSFSEGSVLGRSNDITVTLGGGTITPPILAGLTDVSGSSMIQVVPEPSTIALGILGVAALFIRRRK